MERKDLTALRPSGPAAVVALATLLGLALRLPGLRSRGLFFDDAWMALPARVPLGEAIHLLVTAPGFTLAERWWIIAGPGGTRWALLLPLLTGLALPAASYGLTRYLGYARWTCATIAVAAAVCPAAVEYSVRVKEYGTAALLAAALLALGERCWRRPSRGSYLSFLAVSVLAVAIAGITIPVVVASWLALLLRGFSAARARARAAALWAGLTALLVAPVLVAELRSAPPNLKSFWVDALRLVGSPYSPQHLSRIVASTTAGLIHGLLGIPVPTNVLAGEQVSAPQVLSFCAVALVLMGLLVAGGLALWRRYRMGGELAALGAWCSLLLALGAWAVGFYPLGTGRVEIVFLPSLFVLTAWACTAAAQRLGSLVPRPLALALAGVLGLGAVGYGWHFRAWYPSQDLAGIEAAIAPQREAGDLTVVAYRNGFTWAFEGRSPWRAISDRHAVRSGTVGYAVELTGPRYIVGERNELGLAGPPEPFALAAKARGASSVWVIGITTQVESPSSKRVRRAQSVDKDDGITGALEHLGWHRAPGSWHAAGVWAAHFVR